MLPTNHAFLYGREIWLDRSWALRGQEFLELGGATSSLNTWDASRRGRVAAYRNFPVRIGCNIFLQHFTDEILPE